MFRKRIEYEHNLLITRTGIFLIPNGLLVTAIGVGTTEPFKCLIAFLGLAVAGIWLVCSLQSWKVIKALTIAHLNKEDGGEVEKVVQTALARPGILRPTDLLAKVLPALFLIAWLVMFFAHARLWYLQ